MIKKKLYKLHVSIQKHIAQHRCLFELMRVFSCVCAAGVGMEGERVGEGERDAPGEVHRGAEQTGGGGRRRPLHPHHQQRDGVGLPVHLQLYGLEFVWTRHHDHLPGGERCVSI